jgi:hypothetical protein
MAPRNRLLQVVHNCGLKGRPKERASETPLLSGDAAARASRETPAIPGWPQQARGQKSSLPGVAEANGAKVAKGLAVGISPVRTAPLQSIAHNRLPGRFAGADVLTGANTVYRGILCSYSHGYWPWRQCSAYSRPAITATTERGPPSNSMRSIRDCGALSVAWRDALRRVRPSARGRPQSRPRRSLALHAGAWPSIKERGPAFALWSVGAADARQQEKAHDTNNPTESARQRRRSGPSPAHHNAGPQRCTTPLPAWSSTLQHHVARTWGNRRGVGQASRRDNAPLRCVLQLTWGCSINIRRHLLPDATPHPTPNLRPTTPLPAPSIPRHQPTCPFPSHFSLLTPLPSLLCRRCWDAHGDGAGVWLRQMVRGSRRPRA